MSRAPLDGRRTRIGIRREDFSRPRRPTLRTPTKLESDGEPEAENRPDLHPIDRLLHLLPFELEVALELRVRERAGGADGGVETADGDAEIGERLEAEAGAATTRPADAEVGHGLGKVEREGERAHLVSGVGVIADLEVAAAFGGRAGAADGVVGTDGAAGQADAVAERIEVRERAEVLELEVGLVVDVVLAEVVAEAEEAPAHAHAEAVGQESAVLCANAERADL